MKKKKFSTKCSLIYILLSILTLFLLYFGKEIMFLLPWKTYTNEEYGFSVKYPRNFYLHIPSNKLIQITDFKYYGGPHDAASKKQKVSILFEYYTNYSFDDHPQVKNYSNEFYKVNNNRYFYKKYLDHTFYSEIIYEFNSKDSIRFSIYLWNDLSLVKQKIYIKVLDKIEKNIVLEK